jgi:hypothetical protein
MFHVYHGIRDRVWIGGLFGAIEDNYSKQAVIDYLHNLIRRQIQLEVQK